MAEKCLILFMILILAVCPALAETPRADDLTYIVLEDDTAAVTGYYGEKETLSLPHVLDGHPVSGIGEMAFANNVTLKKLILPEGLKYIGRRAFSGARPWRPSGCPGAWRASGRKPSSSAGT